MGQKHETPRRRKPPMAVPARQLRLLARIRKAGGAYLDRSESGCVWRTPDGRAIEGGVLRRLLDRGLLTASGDALLPGDTQTVTARPFPAPVTSCPIPAGEMPAGIASNSHPEAVMSP